MHFFRRKHFPFEISESCIQDADFYNKSIFEMTKKDLRDFCCEFCYMNIDTEKQSLDNIQNKGYDYLYLTASNKRINFNYLINA